MVDRPNDTNRDILITGSSGLVGTALKRPLSLAGYRPVPLIRKKEGESQDGVVWDPSRGLSTENLKQLEGIDSVVNLAGESIMGRFTENKKKRIRESRVPLTRHLCEGLAKLKTKPRVLVSASASGIYSTYEGTDQDEHAPLGDDYLAQVCRDWETATQPARDAGIRVVNLRITPVFSTKGGMLKVMLVPFRLNLGGRLGSGQQSVSWIALEDLVSLILFALDNKEVSGPLNASSPNPVTNAELTDALADAVHRLKGPPVPEFAMRLAMGTEAANHTALSSLRVVPRKALDAGFKFQLPELRGALKHILENNV